MRLRKWNAVLSGLPPTPVQAKTGDESRISWVIILLATTTQSYAELTLYRLPCCSMTLFFGFVGA